MTISEIIDLTESSRIVVRYDTDAECPRNDWDMQTGFVKIHGRGDSRLMDVPAVHDDPTGLIEEAHDRFYDDDGMSRGKAEDLTERWARCFHGLHIEYDAEHGGYWFVHMDNDFSADLTGQAEIIKSERETYRQWAEGDVYGVALERRRPFVKKYADGDEVEGEEWDEVESVWGCYLDRDYTPEVVARQFTLADDEQVVIADHLHTASLLN